MRWTPIVPTKVKRAFRDHPWVFAYAFQTPNERDDGNWYHGLLFRDRDREVFGGFEVISPALTVSDYEKRYDVREIAAKIVRDEVYRESLRTNGDRIADLWTRH